MSGEYSIFGPPQGDPGRPLTVVIADDQALVRGGFRLILKAAGIDVVAEAANGAEAVAAVREHQPDVVLMDIRMPVLDGIEATRRILAAYPEAADSPGSAGSSGSPGSPGSSGSPGSAGSAGSSGSSGSAGSSGSVGSPGSVGCPGRPGAPGAPGSAGSHGSPGERPAKETPVGELRSASCCYQARAPRIIILTTFDLDEYVYAALAAGASGFLLKDVTPEHLVGAVQLIRTGDALLAPSITRRLVERFAAAPGAGSATGTADGAGAGAGAAPAKPGTAAGRPGCDVSALTPRELEVLGFVARGLSNAEIASDLVLSEATVKTHVARILTKLSLRDRVQAVVLAYETGLISPGN